MASVVFDAFELFSCFSGLDLIGLVQANILKESTKAVNIIVFFIFSCFTYQYKFRWLMKAKIVKMRHAVYL